MSTSSFQALSLIPATLHAIPGLLAAIAAAISVEPIASAVNEALDVYVIDPLRELARRCCRQHGSSLGLKTNDFERLKELTDDVVAEAVGDLYSNEAPSYDPQKWRLAVQRVSYAAGIWGTCGNAL